MPARSRVFVSLLLLAGVLGAATPLVLLGEARSANGGRDGFPLDDAWIHLTFARNLHETGSFSYFPGDPTQAGSTAPLYTLLLTAGHFLTENPHLLSYALGIAAHIAFLVVFAVWARQRLHGSAWVLAAVILVGLDGRVGILAVSGMETSLHLLLVAGCFAARLARRWLLCGVLLGLCIWVRPDSLVLAVALAVDGGLAAALSEDDRGKRDGWIRLGAAASGLGIAYVVFNLIIGGGSMPATFAAKTAYYAVNSRLGFLRGDVVDSFANAGWLILAPFALLKLGSEFVALLRRRAGLVRLEIAWWLGLILAYLILLPFAHRFGRYLVPALPAYALLGLAGLRDVTRGLSTRFRVAGRSLSIGAAAAVLFVAGGLQLRGAIEATELYASTCEYHWRRHERAGIWLAENTPPGAVIATHDVGALAYYSRRRIVDIVGVVMPEVIEHLHQPGYENYLERLFTRKGVTHFAALQNWIELSNDEPLFVADPRPEIMEVYAWRPGISHLMPKSASQLNLYARQAVANGDIRTAVDRLQQSLRIDDRSSRSWYYLGAALLLGGQAEPGLQALDRALVLFPRYADARYQRALALSQLGRNSEALDEVQGLIREFPEHPHARALREQLLSTTPRRG